MREPRHIGHRHQPPSWNTLKIQRNAPTRLRRTDARVSGPLDGLETFCRHLVLASSTLTNVDWDSAPQNQLLWQPTWTFGIGNNYDAIIHHTQNLWGPRPQISVGALGI